MLLETLEASLVGTMLKGKEMIRAGYGNKDPQSKEGKGMLRAGYGSKNKFDSIPSFDKL